MEEPGGRVEPGGVEEAGSRVEPGEDGGGRGQSRAGVQALISGCGGESLRVTAEQQLEQIPWEAWIDRREKQRRRGRAGG